MVELKYFLDFGRGHENTSHSDQWGILIMQAQGLPYCQNPGLDTSADLANAFFTPCATLQLPKDMLTGNP